MMTRKKISRLDEVVDLLQDGPVYVRYSRSAKRDMDRGYSLDHGTGQRESGLSAQVIMPDDIRARYAGALYERERTHRGVNDSRPWPRIEDYL